MKYEILEHPSELRIRVYGKILEELFSNAALAMADILKKERKKEGKSEAVTIESVDINSLLVDFLSEILALSQINRIVYETSAIKIICHPEIVLGSIKLDSRLRGNDREDNECELEAELVGYPVDSFDEDIKAVTYEDLDIKKVDDQWETMIVFDI